MVEPADAGVGRDEFCVLWQTQSRHLKITNLPINGQPENKIIVFRLLFYGCYIFNRLNYLSLIAIKLALPPAAVVLMLHEISSYTRAMSKPQRASITRTIAPSRCANC